MSWKCAHPATSRIIGSIAAFFFAYGASGAFSPVAAQEPAVTLSSLEAPIVARVQTPLHLEGIKVGDPFTAQVPQDLFYQTGLIPAGSYLVGEVERARASRHFGRPGYFQIRFNAVTYPDGETFVLAQNTSTGKGAREKKSALMQRRFYHPKAKRAGGILKNNLASSSVGMATTITLTALGTMAFPYALGARVAAGAVYEGFWGDKSRSPGKRVLVGGFRGTGVPGAYQFLRKQPSPAFELNDPIAIRLPSNQSQTLFSHRRNPDVDWRNAGFCALDWSQPASLQTYAALAKQLSKPPAEDARVLTEAPSLDATTPELTTIQTTVDAQTGPSSTQPTPSLSVATPEENPVNPTP
ncbi:MAG: hypothetical protein IPK79_08515 [Vampirovibrionales bacterium]|nr:hypothetical protein [Vampirovibrionales bacterium]